MARPLRIEFEGALYHVMARGNAQADIFLDDEDRQAFLDNLGQVCDRFDWRVWAWCQITNHYHLLIETLRPTLSKGMREVNGVNADNPYDHASRPGYLGSESFIETILDRFDNTPISTEIPKRLRPAHSLSQIAKRHADREQAIIEAYRSGAYTLTEIARYFKIHLSTASRIARRKGNARSKT